MDKMKVSYEAMLSLTAEMIWDDAIRKYRVKKMYAEIDKALASGDEARFLTLTDKLKTLQ